MRVQIFQHVSFESSAEIAPILLAGGAVLSHTRWFAGDAAPDPDDFDALVVMGGPMSANDEDKYAWLSVEKQLLRDAIAAGKPVLGICLGAQLIASALGARVYPGRQPEIGWFNIEGLNRGPGEYAFPASLEVMHWHGETFDLPPGAQHLARSAGCENQAFCIGNKVVGLQFHLEMGAQAVEDILTHCGDEISDGQYMQSADQIRQASAHSAAAARAELEHLLDAWLAI